MLECLSGRFGLSGNSVIDSVGKVSRIDGERDTKITEDTG